MSDVQYRLAELERMVANLLRIGVIGEADYDAARVKVRLGDLVTGWLPWFADFAMADKSWKAPEIDEQVMVLSPSGDLAQGVAMPAIYQTAAPAPSTKVGVTRAVFADGLVIEHDREAKRTVLNGWDSEGTLEIRFKNVIIKTGGGGFFHLDHAGKATRITHDGGANYTSETWETGAVVTGPPDHGHNPPEVEI